VANKTAREVLDGSLGYFWPSAHGVVVDVDSAEPERGYVHLNDRAALVETLIERPFDGIAEAPDTDAIVATTGDFGVLFLERSASANATVWGRRASFNSWRFQTVIANIRVDQLKSHDLTMMSADFLGVTDWSGIGRLETHPTYHDNSTSLKEVSVRLFSEPEDIAALGDGREIFLTTNWSAHGSVDRQVLLAPTTVGVRASVPVSFQRLLLPILQVQDLLNVMFGGFVDCQGGDVQVDYGDQPLPAQPPTLWNSALMERPPAAQPPAERLSQVPLVPLHVLGGIDALARWIELYDRSPAVVGAITGSYRNGITSWASLLLSVSSAIEYWVIAHRGDPNHRAASFLGDVGEYGLMWLRNPAAWRRDYLDLTNDIKHGSQTPVDPSELRMTALIARSLLTMAIVREISLREESVQWITENSARMDEQAEYLRRRYPTIDRGGQLVNDSVPLSWSEEKSEDSAVDLVT